LGTRRSRALIVRVRMLPTQPPFLAAVNLPIEDMALFFRSGDCRGWQRGSLSAAPAVLVRGDPERRLLPGFCKRAGAIREGTEHEGDQLGDRFRLSVGGAVHVGILAERLIQLR